MDGVPAMYMIRINVHLGAMLLSAFPQMVRDSTSSDARERGRQSREQFTASTRRASRPLGPVGVGQATHKLALRHGRMSVGRHFVAGGDSTITGIR
jgi:hypothetical protein